MKRENTHIVIKNEDAKKYLSESQKRELDNILLSINNGRISDNKSVNTYLIVNKDEPYAEKIQDMIIFEESKKINNEIN